MSNIIYTTKRYFLPLLLVAVFTSISSCSSNTTSGNVDSETPAPTTTPTSTSSPTPIQIPNNASSPTPKQVPNLAPSKEKTTTQESPQEDTSSPTPKATTNKTTDVTLYTSDVQCQKLIPQKASVPAEEPVTNAVGKIIEQRDTSDFSLSGYRVNVKNGVATVDLRLSPESKRQIISLSSCEQFALFGSLRKTLTSNAQWNIKEVRFTSRGEEIVF
ncbi:MAG: GerMN domain-containing protein [Desmonostoc vinosum HA7617-LM4]|jgi:hypothetical protein|nr:GerMN domain-containing protein [Desmonostoc vinosum HA7617-LM4]